jgi:sugar transferase (PEP-CTERM system associated)
MLRLFRHYIPASLIAAIGADLVIVFVAVGLSGEASRAGTGWLVWPKAAAVAMIVGFTLSLADLYRADARFGARETVARVLVALLASAILVAALGFAFPALGYRRLAFLKLFLIAGPALVASKIVRVRIRSSDRLRTRVIVLGVSRAAPTIVKLQASGAVPFTVLGFLDDTPGAHDKLPPGYDLLGKAKDLLNIVEELQPDLVLVSLPNMRGAFPADDLLHCRLRGIRVEDWPTFYEKQTGKILVTGLRPSWLIFSDGFVKSHTAQTFKRATDIVFSLVGLVLSLPLIAVIAAAIKATSAGPVLFRQQRVGQSGRVFVLYKFRSMYADAERQSGPVWASRDDPRVTPVGRILRRLRLDEWPQLVNVLRGDMSFVGPRPERPEFVRMLQRQIPFYAERLTVKPGITGWAQVRHQYSASVEDSMEKLQYDLYYIKNLSPFLDLLIILNTVHVVLFAEGAR